MTKIKRSSRRGKRGQALEKLIEVASDQYRIKGRARIDKVPTPMKTYKGKTFYDSKSTVDFSGTIKGGRSVDFDAKATKDPRLPVTDETHIRPHQIEYLREKHQLGGIAFLLVEFTEKNEHYVIPYDSLAAFIERAEAGGRRSIAYDEFTFEYNIHKIEPGPGVVLDFLKPWEN
jgi:recombination protein U